MKKPVDSIVNTVIRGDIRLVAKELPSETFQAIITSPPYWMQRRYSSDGIGEIGRERVL